MMNGCVNVCSVKKNKENVVDTPQMGQWFAWVPTARNNNAYYIYVLEIKHASQQIRYDIYYPNGHIHVSSHVYPIDKFMVEFDLVEGPPFSIPRGCIGHSVTNSETNSDPKHSLLHAPLDEEVENRRDDETMRKYLFPQGDPT